MVPLACFGCDGEDIRATNDPTPAAGNLGLFNAMPDSPQLDVEFEANANGSSGSVPLSFGDSLFQSVTVGEFDIIVRFTRPSGELVTVIQELGADGPLLGREDEVVVTIAGTLDAPVLVRSKREEYLLGVEIPANPADLAVDPQVQFQHTTTGVGATDIYLTDANDDLAASTPTVTLDYLGTSAMMNVAASDNYRIRVTPAGDRTTLLYDSGVTSLPLNTRSYINTINYFGPDPKAMTLRLINPVAATFPNEDVLTTVRVVNLIADLPAVDVYRNVNSDPAIFTSVAFRDRQGPVPVPSGVATMRVAAAGVSGTFVLEQDVSFARGTSNVLFLGGAVGSDPAVQGVSAAVAIEDPRRVASAVLLTAFNGSLNSNVVDIFLLAPGQTTRDIEAQFPSLPVGTSAAVAIPAGTYDIVVIETVSNTELFGPARFELSANATHALELSDTAGGGPPSELLLHSIP